MDNIKNERLHCLWEGGDVHYGGHRNPALPFPIDESWCMHKLKKGIHRFRRDDFRSSHALFKLPSHTGRPAALVITCSDLPIDPYSLIPTNFADLFVLQNVGNLVGSYDARYPNEGSSVEAAVALYGLKDVVVCGHESCEVMRNILTADERKNIETRPVVPALRHAERTRQIIGEHYGHLNGESLLAATIEENVLVQLENLRTFPTISSRLDERSLHLHGWIYAGGGIFAYDPHQEQFAPLTQ